MDEPSLVVGVEEQVIVPLESENYVPLDVVDFELVDSRILVDSVVLTQPTDQIGMDQNLFRVRVHHPNFAVLRVVEEEPLDLFLEDLEPLVYLS